MARNKILLVGFLLSLFVTISHAAVEQEFEISKKLSGINQTPRIAVNTGNGDSLVIWNRHLEGNTTDFSIYMALCKRKSNGTYKVTKARQVSPANHSSGFADVAYNPEDNSYLVVWSASIKNDVTGDTETFVRKINASGRAKGNARNISINTRHHDRSPVINYSSDPGASSPAGKGGYMVVWTSRSRVGGELHLSGLFSLLLDQDGKATGSPHQVKKLNNNEDGYTNSKLIRTDDGNFALATLFRVQLDPYIERPFLFKIRNNGTFIRETVLDQDYGFSFAAVNLSKKLLFCFWRTANFTGYQGVRAKNLKALKKQAVSGDETRAYKNDIVKFDSDPGAYHIFSAGYGLYGQYISSRGKLVGESGVLTQSLEYFYGAVAAAVPGSNEILVVCTVSNDLHKEADIRGYVINPLD